MEQWSSKTAVKSHASAMQSSMEVPCNGVSQPLCTVSHPPVAIIVDISGSQAEALLLNVLFDNVCTVYMLYWATISCERDPYYMVTIFFL